MKQVNLHLISDSTGETLGAISRAVVSQFKGVEVKEFMWSLVRTETRIKEAIESIKQNPGIVLYTILNGKLLEILLKECKKNKIKTISALDRVIRGFSDYIGEETINMPGRQHVLDEDYFQKIEAINYTINHDDGQKVEELDEAEIVLVGPSRTSKSPTCIYLSYRGLKAANVPFIYGVEMPKIITELKKPLVIGLTINPEVLVQIRTNRIKQLKSKISEDNEYLSLDMVKKEILEARRLYNANGWEVIDITRKSVEETAAEIMQTYVQKR